MVSIYSVKTQREAHRICRQKDFGTTYFSVRVGEPPL